jgi:hypothetical protein
MNVLEPMFEVTLRKQEMERNYWAFFSTSYRDADKP